MNKLNLPTTKEINETNWEENYPIPEECNFCKDYNDGEYGKCRKCNRKISKNSLDNTTTREEWEEKIMKKEFIRGDRDTDEITFSFNIFDTINSILLSREQWARADEREELVEKIEKLNRFRCGACDGAKMNHCQACLMKEDIINLIKEEK